MRGVAGGADLREHALREAASCRPATNAMIWINSAQEIGGGSPDDSSAGARNRPWRVGRAAG
jgi:hypothetical protein